jgi:hypothetical protein
MIPDSDLIAFANLIRGDYDHESRRGELVFLPFALLAFFNVHLHHAVFSFIH